MEQFGSISELNWSFSDESEDIMSQLFGASNHNTNMNEQDSIFWSNQEITACDMLGNHNSEAGSYNLLDNLSSFWSDTSNINTSSTSNFPYNSAFEFQNHQLGNTNAAPNTNSSKYCVSEEIMSQNDKNVLKCISIDTNSENIVLEKDYGIKKKARASSHVTKKEKSGKKAKKSEESINASCSSEDESNTSQELNDPTSSNAKGKTRACRGSATDPQSLYARKRRERINERLKILQTLVPNGTKVDISTMLEEAVQYVKFLQLQIKLLSSDELWMYAPLAYNGMDIGLDLKIHLPQQQ